MVDVALDPRLVGIAVTTLLLTTLILRNRRPSPPGPAGLPFFGNMFDLPKKESWKVYLEWSKQYSAYFSSLQT